MRSEITTATVGEHFELENGFAFKSKDFSSDGVPVIKIKNVKAGFFSEHEFSYVSEEFVGQRPTKVARRGDLLISMSGNRHDGSPETWVGKIAPFDKSGTYLINQRVGALRMKSSGVVDSRYAGYVLSSWPYQKQFIAIATSSGGQANLSPRQILGAEFSFPEMAAQRSIADTLDALNNKIANNRALAADLEDMARAIFKSWFVDFDPVKAKMEGRAPAGMDADTAALFPDELVESELGLIPKGWEVGTLESQADLNPESWSARNHPDAVQYADLSGTDRGQILETKEFAWTDAPSRARRALRPGDTIVGTVRPGNRAYSYVGIDGLTGSTGFAVLRPHGTSQRSFVYLAATSDDAIERLTNLADGAAYPAVRPDVVLATPIVAPPDTVLREFAKLTAPLLDWMVAGHAENTELAKLRDALLPRLISGKLRLPCTPTEAGSTPSEEHADV